MFNHKFSFMMANESSGYFVISLPEPLGSQGELIVYPCSGVRCDRHCRRRRQQFQTSSHLKPLGQSKPNFMWSLLGKGEPKFI